MLRKLSILFIGFIIVSNVFAQTKPAAKDPILDTSVDYDELFNELDDFLDSLLAPRSYTSISVGLSNNYFDFNNSSTNKLITEKKTMIMPSFGYYDKTGFGLNVSANIINENQKLNPYQFIASLSYDYIKNLNFATGVAASHYFTKDSLSFYTSPLKNDIYAYFSYRNSWFKPTIAASYGWGSRTSYEEQEEYVKKLRLRKRQTTTITTQESVSDFSTTISVRHDFYWLDVVTNNDFVRLSPQLSFTSGTQTFGFNQTTNSYRTQIINGKPQMTGSENITLDDEMKFQPISVAAALRSEFSIGKYFLQPQLMFNYYIPAAEKNLSAFFSVNTGFNF